MKKQDQKSKVITAGMLAALVLGMFLTVFGLSRAIAGVDEVAISKTPEAILASAGVKEESTVGLPVAYFDQKADQCVNLYDAQAKKDLAKRQFEWTTCGYTHRAVEQGMVDYSLGQDYLPVALGGKLTSNIGTKDMKRWFSDVEGQSKAYSGALNLKYKVNEFAEFSFIDDSFYPLDDAQFSADDKVNSDGHNHLFTMNFAVPFVTTLSGNETFEIMADDDTFVYLNDQLLIDMGGIHEATSGKFVIHDNGEVYAAVLGEELAYSGVSLNQSEDALIRIFHADRDSRESELRLKLTDMNLNVVQTELAGADTGVQVAYDPTDPLYVAPLGQSLVVRPDNTRGYMIMATIEGVLLVGFTILAVMMARSLIKQKSEK